MGECALGPMVNSLIRPHPNLQEPLTIPGSTCTGKNTHKGVIRQSSSAAAACTSCQSFRALVSLIDWFCCVDDGIEKWIQVNSTIVATRSTGLNPVSFGELFADPAYDKKKVASFEVALPSPRDQREVQASGPLSLQQTYVLSIFSTAFEGSPAASLTRVVD